MSEALEGGLSDYDFCPSCNQYGCHTPECVKWLQEELAANRACNLFTWKQKYEQARSDYEVMRIENFSLMNQIRTMKRLDDEMAEEYHKLLNEPMYAGTRKDWIFRAQKAEAEVDSLKQKHAEELSRLLRRIALMEDIFYKRQLEQI